MSELMTDRSAVAKLLRQAENDLQEAATQSGHNGTAEDMLHALENACGYHPNDPTHMYETIFSYLADLLTDEVNYPLRILMNSGEACG